MNTEITKTQIASEGVADSSTQSLSRTSKPRTPVRKDDTQTAQVDKDTNQKLPEDSDKVIALVKETVENFEKFIKDIQVDLKYEVDDKTNDVIVKFFEKGTGKLIKQIPAEAILKLKQRINDLLGIIYDEMF